MFQLQIKRFENRNSFKKLKFNLVVIFQNLFSTNALPRKKKNIFIILSKGLHYLL